MSKYPRGLFSPNGRLVVRACESCGCRFEQKRGRPRRWCSACSPSRDEVGSAGSSAAWRSLNADRVAAWNVERRKEDPRCVECGAPVANGHRPYCDSCRSVRGDRKRRSRSSGRGWQGFRPQRRRCDGPDCSAIFIARAPHGRFCSNACRERARRRARPEARGYDASHRARRQQLVPIVSQGRTACARCGELILPGQAWDLGHDDRDRSRYSGPEHRRCNRQTAKHRKQQQRVASREW